MHAIEAFWELVDEVGSTALELWAFDFGRTLADEEHKRDFAVALIDEGPDGIADVLNDDELAAFVLASREAQAEARARGYAELGELQLVAA